ncbi:MAG: ATP-grasp domain-containing protein [Angustibacter sp.]
MEPHEPDLSQVTHLAVGLSFALLTDLERLLPSGSVLVIDEPDTLMARNARERVAHFQCLAGIVEAPTQDESNAGQLRSLVPRPDRLRAVVPALEYGVVGAAALADSWGLPGQGVAAARILRDKARLREVGDHHDIDQPAWAVIDGPAGIDRFRARFGHRCVVKPVDRQASVGVRLLEPDDEASVAWADSAAADETKHWARHSRASRHLVEQRLDGPELSVEALVVDGERVFTNITAKSVQHGDHPVEVGHVVPAQLDPAIARRVRTSTDRLLAAVGYRSGVIHAEWILVDGVPYLIECAGRLPGDAIDLLINLAYGGDLTTAYLDVLEGHRPAPSTTATQSAAIRFLTAAAGVVTRVDGLDRASAAVGVTECEVSTPVGSTVEVTTSSWDRVGHVIATGADPLEADSRAIEAAAMITVVTAPAS